MLGQLEQVTAEQRRSLCQLIGEHEVMMELCYDT